MTIMTPTEELTATIIEYCNKIISRAPDIFYGDDSINELICPFCEVPISIETRICGKCGVGIPDFDSPESSDELVEENDSGDSDIMAIDKLLWLGEELSPDTKISIIADSTDSNNLPPYNSTDYIGAFRMRGNAYYNVGEYDKALGDFNEIIRFKLLAIKKLLPYYEEKKDISSIEGLKQCILPNLAFDYVRKGVVYSKLKQLHKTIENFWEAILLNCDSSLLTRLPSGGYNSCNNEGQFCRVISDFTRIIENESWNGFAYACLCFCLYYNYSFNNREAEVNKALNNLAKAIALESDLVFAYNLRANIFRDQQQYDESLEELNKAIAIDPKNISSYVYRGYTYVKLMKYGKAIDDFNTVLQLRPDNLFVASQLSLLYSWKKDFGERVEKHTRTINQFPDKAAGYIYRSSAYYQIGHFDASFYNQALADLNVALKLNPKSSMAYTYRGSVLIEMEQIDKAIEDFNTAISLKPTYDLAYNLRGIAYLKKGDYLKAKDDFGRSNLRYNVYNFDYYCRMKVQRELEKRGNINVDKSQEEEDHMHHALEIQSFKQQANLRGKYLEITVLRWERNKEFKCTCGIYENEICSYKTKDIVVKPIPKKIKCSILKLKVENISSQLIGTGEAYIVDSLGKMHKAGYLCEHLVPRGYESYLKELYDGTNANFYLVFLEFDDGVDIARFIYRQDIFDPGETSGCVRDKETFDFKLTASKVSN